MIQKKELEELYHQFYFSFSQGVQIFRVHNVEEVKQGILVFETLLNK
jgi:hypothetical protein